jgi:lysophospholipase L1-like esterase
MTLRAAGLLSGLLLALTACSGEGSAGEQDYTPPPAVLPEVDEDPAVQRYVALGDSYTAGPNVPPVDTTSGGCFRSSGNYPSLVAGSLDPDEFVDASCGGATTVNTTDVQQTTSGTVPPQFDALDEQTDLVTIGLGGNDFNLFATLIGYCPTLREEDPTGAPCREALDEQVGGDRLRDVLPRIRDRLADVVRGVRERAPQAEVLLVGYPEIIPEEGTCPERLPLATGDYPYAREVSEGLNAAVRAAARRVDVRYLDVAEVTAGHDICSDDPWVNGRQPASDAQIYHPFPEHQEAVAVLVLEALGADLG